ncbi:MAG: S8 family serine peptidase [Ekhidna sp.]
MKGIKLVFLFLSSSVFGQQLGFALEQINGQAIIDEGLTGKGVKVGIIDGGFMRADKVQSLQQIFEKELVEGYKDYVSPNAEMYSGSAGFDDGHGTEVWSLIAGFNKEKNVQFGLATDATYYLARTDHGDYEKRIEEEWAIEAMEWMAKEGVRVINMSLGYNFGYTNKKENYRPEQMDGKTTEITKAVDRISKEYGILFVISAGNDGNKRWKIIAAPADAKSALTVGATKFKVWDEMHYSSKGPDFLEYVKPEISCYSTLGTSFSAPIITGLAACLLEANPTLSGEELKQVIIKSGSLEASNNYVGFGVPDAQRALDLMRDEEVETSISVQSEKKTVKIDINEPSIYVTIYQKNGWKVIDKQVVRKKKSLIKVKRFEDATSSTVIWRGGSVEVIWE